MKIKSKKPKKETVIILDNVRSVHNVGSFFRTADCAGVSRVYLCGVTPEPIDRFGRARGDFAKVALGAEKTVLWKKFTDSALAVSSLKKEGFRIVAVEQDKNSIDYKKYKPASKTAFVFGAEVEGISKNILRLCDKIIEIPMRGKKESLNVSVTGGVILFCCNKTC